MKRVATGLLLGFLFIFLILYATLFWLSVIVSLTVGLALFEYYRIVVSRDRGLLWLGTLLGATVPIIIFLFGLKGFSGYLIFTVFFIFTYCLFIHDPLVSVTNRIGAGVLGIVYIAFSLSHLILLRNLEHNIDRYIESNERPV
ncbi:MAG: hypothetical protein HY026_04050 [Deltaproteobacteria bacterium]|nr:hypothetical protein [Deltaproteobacteria bacterium]